jgi:hypothetical protein
MLSASLNGCAQQQTLGYESARSRLAGSHPYCRCPTSAGWRRHANRKTFLRFLHVACGWLLFGRQTAIRIRAQFRYWGRGRIPSGGCCATTHAWSATMNDDSTTTKHGALGHRRHPDPATDAQQTKCTSSPRDQPGTNRPAPEQQITKQRDHLPTGSHRKAVERAIPHPYLFQALPLPWRINTPYIGNLTSKDQVYLYQYFGPKKDRTIEPTSAPSALPNASPMLCATVESHRRIDDSPARLISARSALCCSIIYAKSCAALTISYKAPSTSSALNILPQRQ